MNIGLLDHIIVAGTQYYSFSDHQSHVHPLSGKDSPIAAHRYIVPSDEKAQEEIEKMCNLCMDALDSLQDHTANKLSQIVQLEQKNDDMTAQFRQNQLDRIRKGSCSEEGCVLRIAY